MTATDEPDERALDHAEPVVAPHNHRPITITVSPPGAAVVKVATKRARLPKCAGCGNPMWLGQIGTHHSCRGPEDEPEHDDEDEDAPDVEPAPPPCPVCRGSAVEHPEGYGPCWQGRSRMAAAKRGAGLPLNDLDVEALSIEPGPEFLTVDGYRRHRP